MTRKSRRAVAIAAALYLFILWWAFRWGVNLRPADGSIYQHIEREGIKRLAAERAQAALQAASPGPTAELRLVSAGPAYVAARYDATHVVFMVASETESRFSASVVGGANAMHVGGTPTLLSEPERNYAPLAGFRELYAPDSQSLHFFPKLVQEAVPGDKWSMNLAGDVTVPVAIERTVIAPVGCSLSIGFLASVPADQQAAFEASGKAYFVVWRADVPPAEPALAAHVSEIAWKPSAEAAKKIDEALNARMREELGKIDARLTTNAANPSDSSASLYGGVRAQVKEWLHADQGLARGEGHLGYDLRAYRITPDGVPRLLVRARWTLAGANAFLMTAWFLGDESLALLWSDAHWSNTLRDGLSNSIGGDLEFQSVLNEFDADHDGWAELLVHTQEGNGSSIGLYLYTDLGLVPLKSPLRRDAQSPEACLEQ
jgi:hypothetical protein